jgi:hypothetical protein
MASNDLVYSNPRSFSQTFAQLIELFEQSSQSQKVHPNEIRKVQLPKRHAFDTLAVRPGIQVLSHPCSLCLSVLSVIVPRSCRENQPDGAELRRATCNAAECRLLQ